MARFGASPTAAAMARAAAAKAAGRPVISLTTGEPDFDTPAHIREAAVRAMHAGQTRYTAVDGTPELKRAVRAKFARENGLDYAPEEVIVSTGAKQAIFNAVLALVGPGDEVIVPAPAWVSYVDMVKLAGGQPVILPTRPEDGFRPRPADLARLLTPRTRMLLLNSPSNPTGAVLGAADLRALADVLDHAPQVVAISDDIYEHLIHDGRAFATLAAAAPELRDRVLTVNGVSKAFAMTGWRIGYAGGPAWLIAAMKALQSQSTTNACSVAQAAAVAALDGGLDTVAAMRAAFEARRDRLHARLSQVPGLSVARPDGAFYLFAECGGWIGARTAGGRRLEDEAAVVDALLEEADLGVVGGAAFGLSPWLRLTFAAGNTVLDEAAARIARFADGLSR